MLHACWHQSHTRKLTASVLVLSIRAVWDEVTAKYGGQADTIRTLEMSNRTAILRRNSSRHDGEAKLFIGLVCTVLLSVTPPALWDALEGVFTLVLVLSTGHRLGSYWSKTKAHNYTCMHGASCTLNPLQSIWVHTLNFLYSEISEDGFKRLRLLLQKFSPRSESGWKENVRVGLRKQHNINVIAFPPCCPLCLPSALTQPPQWIYMDLQGNRLH